MTPRPLLTLVVALLAAGCLGGEKPSQVAPGPPDVSAAPVVPKLNTFGILNCTQYRSGFVAQAAGFEKYVPQGFRLATTDVQGRFVTLSHITTDCKRLSLTRNGTTSLASATVGDYLIGVPILPPASLKNDSYLADLAIIGLYATNASVRELYDLWGLQPAAEAVTFTSTPTPVVFVGRADTVKVATSKETYTHYVGVVSGTTVFSKDALRLWQGTTAAPQGFVRLQWGDIAVAGYGSVTLSYSGPGTGAAPTVSEGTTYLYVDLGTRFTYERIVPA